VIETSLLFQQAMSSSRTIFSQLDIVLNGVITASAVPLTKGTVTTDRSNNERYSASGVTLAYYPWEDRPPFDIGGHRARIYTGVESIGIRETVQVGEYLIYDYGDNHKGELTLTLKGLEFIVIKDRFIRPRTPPYGASTVSTIVSLITESIPDAEVVIQCSRDKRITSTSPWEKERWDAVTALANSIETEVYAGHDGRFYITDVPDLERLTPVAKMIAGPSGVLIAESTSRSRDKVYNAWSVSGQSSDPAVPAVWGFAYDSDPDSPTFYGRPDPLPEAASAAQQIYTRFQSNRVINPDWTWTGSPAVVNTHAPALRTDWLVDNPGTPTAQAWLNAYITANTPAPVSRTTTPPMTQAAKLILARMNAGQQIFEDWTWHGNPQVVRDYNDQLVALAPPLSGKNLAAYFIWLRFLHKQPIFEDWTWYGLPVEVNTYNGQLQTEYEKAGGNFNNTAQAMNWLRTYYQRPQKAFLDSYIRTHPPTTTIVTPPVPDHVAAATLIRDRLASTARTFPDWTWPGAPALVINYREQLLLAYAAEVRASAVTWLETYLDSFDVPTFSRSRSTYGRVVGFYSSQFFTSDAQCQAYAQRKLAESLSYVSTMTISAPPTPMVEAGDAIAVTDEKGVPLPDQLLDQTTLQLSTSAWNAVCLATGSTAGET
jgi:hypothetical protein